MGFMLTKERGSSPYSFEKLEDFLREYPDPFRRVFSVKTLGTFKVYSHTWSVNLDIKEHRSEIGTSDSPQFE